jgi:hypothetical protein
MGNTSTIVTPNKMPVPRQALALVAREEFNVAEGNRNARQENRGPRRSPWALPSSWLKESMVLSGRR